MAVSVVVRSLVTVMRVAVTSRVVRVMVVVAGVFFFSGGFAGRMVSRCFVRVAWEKFDAGRQGGPQEQAARQFEFVVRVRQGFGEQIGQGDAEECPSRKGEGAPGNQLAGIES
jgi:hypothetical protein